MASRPLLFALLGCLLGAREANAAPAPRGYDGPGDVGIDEATPEVEHGLSPDEAPKDEAPKEAKPEPTEAPKEVERPVYAHRLDEPEETTGAGELKTPPPPESSPRASAGVKWMPPHRLVYRNFTAARIGPPGLVNETTLGYRAQLVRRPTPLFLESYALVAGKVFMTPAFVRVGPVIEIQPAAVLNLGVSYDFVGTFGNLGQLQSYPSAADRSGPDEFDRNKDAGLSYRTRGHLVTLSGLLQGRVKNIVVRTQTRAMWASFKLRTGDRVFYDQALDIPMGNRGWAIINETDLIYMFPKLRLAVRHSLTHAFYERRHFAPGEPVSEPNGPTSRLGPAFAYTFFDRPGTRFNRPTVFALSQWWLEHRWRTGEERHAAIPYAAIGFAFEGDIVPHRPDHQRPQPKAKPKAARIR